MASTDPKSLFTQVLVIGGGTSGVCAAIQSARSGAETILTEEGPWLGGMLTAAGVSATDGNHLLPSGLWGEFRTRLTSYYGGPGALATGWVSHTQFEPHVGNEIFQRMVKAEPLVRLYHGFWPIEVLKEENRVVGAVLRNEAGETLSIRAHVVVDATEYSDVAAMAGVEYRLGRESKAETGEPCAPEKPDQIIQDLTVVACLKDYGPEANRTIPEPPGYDANAYAGCCREAPVKPPAKGYSGDLNTLLNYGRLPNGKYMINWPAAGNDYYVNVIEMTREERKKALRAARQFTLGFVYFMQTVLGMRRLGPVTDEFPTNDNLAIIPYNRESRRIKGMVLFRSMDVLDPYRTPSGPLYKTGIAVGDYPLDHHHTKPPVPIEERYPSIPAFTVPYGVMIPETMDGLLVAEHGISVTHIVNGCTRLQPCVMLIGQAAGAAAALCAASECQPRRIDIRTLQQMLLDARCWCMPFRDTLPRDWDFQALQRVALAGVLEGALFPDSWSENKILIFPERPVSGLEAHEALRRARGSKSLPDSMASLKDLVVVNRMDLLQAIWELAGSPPPESSEPVFTDVPPEHPVYAAVYYAHQAGWLSPWGDPPEFRPSNQATRAVLATLLDRVFDPFRHLPVEIAPKKY